MLTALVSTVLATVGVLMAYGTARRFVRDRLRFVAAAHQPRTALLAGVATAILALPVVGILSLLPFVQLGVGAMAALGLSVGLGIRAGSTDTRAADRQLRD